MYGELDEQKLAEWKKMPEVVQFKRFKEVMNHKAGLPKSLEDSISALQGEIDSINFIKLSGIIVEFGFPNSYLDNVWGVSAILGHNSDLITDDFLKILRQEVKIKNMPGIEYAIIYDDCQRQWKKPPLYYVVAEHYDPIRKKNTYGTPVKLEETNRARKEIGLKKFKPSE